MAVQLKTKHGVSIDRPGRSRRGTHVALEFKTASVDEVLGEIDIMLRTKVIKKAMRKAGRVVINEIKKRTPRGNPEDRSEKARNPDRRGTKPLYKTITQKIVGWYASPVLVNIIGAEYPAGAHYHLVDQDHEKVLWGRRTAAIVPGKNFVVPATEAARPKYEKVFVDEISKGVAEAAQKA